MSGDFSELESRLTETAKASLERAGVIAHRAGSPYVGTEHLLLGVLAQNSSLGAKVLAECGVTLDRAEMALDLTQAPLVVMAIENGVSQEMLQTMRTAWELAMEFDQERIGTEHLVYSILTQQRARATRLLEDMSVDVDSLKAQLEQMFDRQQYDAEQGSEAPVARAHDLGVLHKFGVDMTEKAINGELDPVVGREKEIDRMTTILGRRSKNNPALIGEPGVGKTAVVEGLAQRIADGAVPPFLQGKRLFQLDLTAMIAGTKYRGQFEERLQKVLAVLKKHQEVIVFIDEMHLLAGAGSAEGSMDAANILKPALARGDMRMIGATTFDEYRKYIEKDAALGRRFQTVVVDEPSIDEAVAMVRGLAGRLAEHHGVRLDDAVLRKAAELAERYIPDRRLPDKAIDVVDEAAALVRASQRPAGDRRRYEQQIARLARQIDLEVEAANYEKAARYKVRMTQLQDKARAAVERAMPVLDEATVRRAVAMMTDVPLAHIEQAEVKALEKLEARLQRHVLGQTEVITEVARAIKRARSGLAPASRPLGSFVFLGPTGVGKTALARVLAREVFGGDKALIKIDMSEFGEKHTASRLVGAPAGYIGYDDGGTLTDAVRRRPYSVVLFDEVEKAHPDVLQLLLQLLEDGQLTDAHGKVVSFRQTIIILTSNLGAEQMTKEAALGFQLASEQPSASMDALHERYAKQSRAALEELMRPELINRFDGILTFRALTHPVVGKIFDLLTAEVRQAVAAQGLQLVVTPAVKRALIQEGYDERHGVRPLRRVIEQRLTSAVADVLIQRTPAAGAVLTARMKQGEVVIDSGAAA